MVIWRKLKRFENSASDHLCPRQSFSTLWKQQDSFQLHSSEHFVWLCYVSTHISRSSCILLLCQAPGSRSHCNCRLFSPPAPRVAFKREKSFFVLEIPQIILRVPPFSLLWPFADERSWQTGVVWVDFVKVSDLFHQQSAEPRTFLELESWESRSRQLCSTADLPAFLSTSLSSRPTNHIQYKIYWEKHKCKELENIQSWVIQLSPDLLPHHPELNIIVRILIWLHLICISKGASYLVR